MPRSHKAPWGGLDNSQVWFERVPALELDAVIARCGSGKRQKELPSTVEKGMEETSSKHWQTQRENEVFQPVPGAVEGRVAAAQAQ